jgi:hypothetical protein
MDIEFVGPYYPGNRYLIWSKLDCGVIEYCQEGKWITPVGADFSWHPVIIRETTQDVCLL